MANNNENNPFELKHLNRKSGCLACQKQYEYTIKMLERQNELLLEMLRMKHLAEPIKIPVSGDIDLGYNKNYKREEV